jgi:hypothetical protein
VIKNVLLKMPSGEWLHPGDYSKTTFVLTPYHTSFYNRPLFNQLIEIVGDGINLFY